MTSLMQRQRFDEMCHETKDRLEDWRELYKIKTGHAPSWTHFCDVRLAFIREVAEESGVTFRSLLNAMVARGL